MTETETEKENERDRENREKKRETDRQTDRQTDRDRHRETELNRRRDIQKEKEWGGGQRIEGDCGRSVQTKQNQKKIRAKDKNRFYQQIRLHNICIKN